MSRLVNYDDLVDELELVEMDIQAQIDFFDDDGLKILSSVDGEEVESSNEDKNIILLEMRNKLRGIKIAKKVLDKVALAGAEAEKVMDKEEKRVFYKMVNFVGKIRKMFNFKK